MHKKVRHQIRVIPEKRAVITEECDHTAIRRRAIAADAHVTRTRDGWFGRLGNRSATEWWVRKQIEREDINCMIQIIGYQIRRRSFRTPQ
jgi:hypothetical protein